MATLILGAVGAAAGSGLGGVGALIGRAAGALAGHALDQQLFGGARTIEGPRLTDLEVQTSTEGLPIAKVYGRARLSGQIIWATDFVEQRTDSAVGGKGSGRTATVIDYLYFANFAVALCEGPITRIDRVWADGKLLDESAYEYRLHLGTSTQGRDGTIASLQGGEVPAYRNIAYIVFERLPLEDFGNRIPQLSFEVVRTLGGLEKQLKAVWLEPSDMEFGRSTEGVTVADNGETAYVINKNASSSRTDFVVALDELQTLMPNLEWVTLSVSWFGGDLRAGRNFFEPKVEKKDRSVSGRSWRVIDHTRAIAPAVSIFQSPDLINQQAFAGTPDDRSFREAIQELKRRGLKICVAPVGLMDISPYNDLPDPYGDARQPAYPNPLLITCDPAPGRSGSPDGSNQARIQIEDFLGETTVDGLEDPGFPFLPDQGDFRYRHMVLHYAVEAKRAGGVDAFLIGTGLEGLTRVRSSRTQFPFVNGLRDLAREVRKALPTTKITYAANLGEVFPIRVNGDLIFHLDNLWAERAIDAIGINFFAHLSDWREGADHADAAIASSIYDRDYLRGNIFGGENYDWYYRNSSDRQAQIRTPITDPVYDKAWVYRPKDLTGWWSNRHFNRFAGVESSNPTSWVPESKPVWITQSGCPAIDKGSNQPEIFRDSRKSQSGVPVFSNGQRDDRIQEAYLDAIIGVFDPAHPDYDGQNPHSNLYDGSMVDPAHIHAWAWDIRPYPAFPEDDYLWSDTDFWARGHSLSGRTSSPDIKSLITVILRDFGYSDFRIENVGGPIAGYVISDHVSARGALEPLLKTFLIDASEHGGTLLLRGRDRSVNASITGEDLVERRDEPLIQTTRTHDSELASEVMLRIIDPNDDFRVTTANSRRALGQSRRVASISLPLIMPASEAVQLTETVLADIWTGREKVTFNLGMRHRALEAGDLVRLTKGDAVQDLIIEEIEDRASRTVTARRVEGKGGQLKFARSPGTMATSVSVYTQPELCSLDIAMPAGGDDPHAPQLAVLAEPWPGHVAIFAASEGGGFRQIGLHDKPAGIGTLLAPLQPGPVGLFDRGNRLEVAMTSRHLVSLPEIDVLGGGNLAAIGSNEDGWEVLQFCEAELIGESQYRLSGLIRGQGGTEAAAGIATPAGARIVLLDDAVRPLLMDADTIGLPRRLRLGPAQYDYAHEAYAEFDVTPNGGGLKPFAPVHLRAWRDAQGGDISLTWIRRTRIGGDNWQRLEVPFNEDREAYRLAIIRNGEIVDNVETEAPSFTYSAAQQRVHFGDLAEQFSVRIAQLSMAAGPGHVLEEIVNV